MGNNLLQSVENFISQHRRKKRWQKVVSALGCMVVFCTVYALILPAITMEKDTICGFEEHEHTDACYAVELIEPQPEIDCVLEEQIEDDVIIVHEHDEYCYDYNGKRICSLREVEEHIHDEFCYAEDRTLLCMEPEDLGHSHEGTCYVYHRGELICGSEEFEGHTHRGECYETYETLSCTQSEVPHVHNSSCYDTTETLQCGLIEDENHAHDGSCWYAEETLICALSEEAHVHDSDCYTLAERLICTMPEVEGHSHTDDCYQWTEELICTEAERPAGHVHEDACYYIEMVLACDEDEIVLHEHDEACVAPLSDWTNFDENALYDEFGQPITLDEIEYDANGEPIQTLYELICELPVVIEHQHTDDCIIEPEGEPYESISLVCGFDEHIHTDACYPAEPEYVCGMTAHSHESDCYDTEGNEICGEIEHVHDEFCLLMEEPVVQYLCGLEEHEHDLYCYGEDGFLCCGTTEHRHEPACVTEPEPVVPDIPTIEYICGMEAHAHVSNCWDTEGNQICGLNEHVHEESCMPAQEPGYECQKEEHVHSETCIGPAGLPVCGMEEHMHDDTCGIAIVLPDQGLSPLMLTEYYYENDVFSMVVHVEGEPVLTEALPEAEQVPVDVNAVPRVMATEEAVDMAVTQEEDVLIESETDYAEMSVEMIEPDSDSYSSISGYLEQEGIAEDLLDLTVMKIDFTYQGVLLDTSDCTITAEVTPKDVVISAAQVSPYAVMSVDAAPEAEIGLEMAVLQQTEEEVSTLSSLYLGPETQDESTPLTLTAPVANNGVLAVAISQTANPRFAVQYYAYLPRLQIQNTQTNNTLKIINTDNGGNNTGGNLPQNGVDNPIYYLTLVDSKPATELVLTETYAAHEYEYIMAPSLAYFNRLYENGNYTHKQIWILKEGCDPASINPDDWDIYDANADIHFTNRPASVAADRILIDEGTVIRLVYDTSSGDYTNATTFYDYDTTNGKIFATESNAISQTSPLSSASLNSTYYVKTDNSSGTDQQGINQAANYSGSGTKLAFGNMNTRVGLENLVWNSNYLNKYNSRNSQSGGCTFGLAASMKNGVIQYSTGVTAAKLFNDGAATGKTQFDGYTLQFKRIGDSYTLAYVLDDSRTSVTRDLSTFVGRVFPSKTIWSNDFWPMDEAYAYVNNYVPGHDMKTGAVDSSDPVVNAVGAMSVAYGNTVETYPDSDDEIAHNNYFGMQYGVEFTLTEDYVGPLEYLFFGDDDMWVFLDGRLVCDIGGVHSSVGEYVNLWDYIAKGSSGTHTLSFFYTERGASGSSCYMHFTLPSVSAIVPSRNTSNLRVEKQVMNGSSDQEYHFDIHFTDSQDDPMKDDYAYTRYDSEGNVLARDIIISDGGHFSLRSNEYVVIKYLPLGTRYTITETEESAAGFDVTIESSTVYSTVLEGRTITGTIGDDQVDPDTGSVVDPNDILFVNHARFELPETGGMGTTQLYTLGGVLLMTATLLLYKKYRRKGGVPSA